MQKYQAQLFQPEYEKLPSWKFVSSPMLNGIASICATSSLLFIGYSLEDINFRIIFRGIVNYLGARYQLASVGVLLSPSGLVENKQNEAQKYLERYTRKMFNIRVYWELPVNFHELRKHWNDFINRE